MNKPKIIAEIGCNHLGDLKTAIKMIEIAIDGTAASGKGTLARKLAEKYGFIHLDTGLLYRKVANELILRNKNTSENLEYHGSEIAKNLTYPEIVNNSTLWYRSKFKLATYIF